MEAPAAVRASGGLAGESSGGATTTTATTTVTPPAAAVNDTNEEEEEEEDAPVVQPRRWTAEDAEALCDLDRADPADAVVDALKIVGGHLLKHERFLRFQQNARLVEETLLPPPPPPSAVIAAATAAARPTMREKRRAADVTQQDVDDCNDTIKRLRSAVARTKSAAKAIQASDKAIVETDLQRLQWTAQMWQRLDEALLPEEVLALRRDMQQFFGRPIEVQFDAK